MLFRCWDCSRQTRFLKFLKKAKLKSYHEQSSVSLGYSLAVFPRKTAVAVCTGTRGRRGLSEPLLWLCLLCMQMSSPIHVLSHRRHSPFSPTPQLVQPFSLTPLPFVLAEGPISARAKLLAVVFVSAEEPISARAKVLFLRVVVCLWHLPLFARSAASSKFAWRGRNAGPRGDVLQSRRRVGNACGPVAISLCCLRVALQSLRVAKFALSLILIIC